MNVATRGEDNGRNLQTLAQRGGEALIFFFRNCGSALMNYVVMMMSAVI